MEELPEYQRVVDKRNRDIKLNAEDLKILSQVNQYFEMIKMHLLEDILNKNFA